MPSITAKRREYAKEGDWDSIIIRRMANGLSIQKCKDWQPGMKVQPKEEKPYIADSPKEAHEQIDPCIDDLKYYGEEKGEK